MISMIAKRTFRSFPGTHRLLESRVHADVLASYHGAPLPALCYPTHSQLLGWASGAQWLISIILAPRNASKVLPTVIVRDAIDVVDVKRGPFTSHHRPDNPMGREEVPPQCASRVSLHHLCESGLVCISNIPPPTRLIGWLTDSIKHVWRSAPPKQLPSLRIISEQLAAHNGRDISSVSHGAGSLRLVRAVRSLVASAWPAFPIRITFRSQLCGGVYNG